MNEADEASSTGSNEPGRPEFSKTDRMLAAFGIVLATASAAFPWYVFFNEEKFGIRVESFDHTRDLPAGHPRDVMSVSPLAMIDNSKDDSLPSPAAATDSMTTATVSSLGTERPGPPAESQPFPGNDIFRLLHVANGRALIEDGSGMYMVKIGSILPDDSKLATIEKRDGQWVIVSSTGQVYGDQGAPRP